MHACLGLATVPESLHALKGTLAAFNVLKVPSGALLLGGPLRGTGAQRPGR